MHRHRIVAIGPDGHQRYTLAVVRFLTDDQARALAKTTNAGTIKDATAKVAVRETFNKHGMTTSKEDI